MLAAVFESVSVIKHRYISSWGRLCHSLADVINWLYIWLITDLADQDSNPAASSAASGHTAGEERQTTSSVTAHPVKQSTSASISATGAVATGAQRGKAGRPRKRKLNKVRTTSKLELISIWLVCCGWHINMWWQLQADLYFLLIGYFKWDRVWLLKWYTWVLWFDRQL